MNAVLSVQGSAVPEKTKPSFMSVSDSSEPY